MRGLVRTSPETSNKRTVADPADQPVAIPMICDLALPRFKTIQPRVLRHIMHTLCAGCLCSYRRSFVSDVGWRRLRVLTICGTIITGQLVRLDHVVVYICDLHTRGSTLLK